MRVTESDLHVTIAFLSFTQATTFKGTCNIHLLHERTRQSNVLQVTVSGLKLTAPRHSWSPDALTIISRSACASSREGSCDATLAKPEISWSSCGQPPSPRQRAGEWRNGAFGREETWM